MKLRLFALVFAMSFAGGCVTNISEKAAAKCAPVADTPDIYADCVRGTEAEMNAKNRRTAQILAAGLGGAAQSQQTPNYSPSARAVGFLKRSYISGFNRICIYNELGSERAITIGSMQACPLSN